MQEHTIIIRLQLTDIVKMEKGEELVDKNTIAKNVRDTLRRYYDDVLVEKVQIHTIDKPQNNLEHIQQHMNVDELAKLLTNYDTRYECFWLRNGKQTNSEAEAIADTKEWLLSKVEG